MRLKMSSENSIPVNFSSLCKILSPWTNDEEMAGIREASNSNKIDWQAVSAYANRANLAPALRHALVTKGLWEGLPDIFQEYLNEMYRLNGERNEAIFHQLYEIIGTLNGAGITPLLMKGGAALAVDLYPDPAIRFMLDLDLLVPDSLHMRAVSALTDDGYFVHDFLAEALEEWHAKKIKHYPALIKNNMPVHVEIHRSVLDDPEKHLLESEKVWQRSKLHTHERMKHAAFVLMSPTDQILHTIIHSELSHCSYKMRRLDLRQLLHFAYLCKRYADTIQWGQLLALCDDRNLHHVLNAYFYAAHMLLGVVTPLTSDLNSEYRQRFIDIMKYHVEGKRKIMRMSRWFITNMLDKFSVQGLNVRFQEQQHDSVGRKRINLVKALLRKYSTVEKLKDYYENKSGPFVRMD